MTAGDLGGGTIAAKVAVQISANEAERESSEADEAIAPTDLAGSADAYDDANAVGPMTARDAGSAFDDDGPMWPAGAAEVAFSSDPSAGARAKPKHSSVEDDNDDAHGRQPLPPLAELVERIPPETREVLEELFRAKFVAVRKISKKFAP